MGQDIAFTGAEVLLITGLLGFLTTPLGLVSKMLLTQMEQRAKRAEDSNDRLIGAIESLVPTVSRSAERQDEIIRLFDGFLVEWREVTRSTPKPP